MARPGNDHHDTDTGRPGTDPAPGQQPPHDHAAEQAVLGAMLLAPAAIATVTTQLRAEDFYRPAHQTIYRTILGLHAAGKPTDTVAVGAEITRAGQLSRIGGGPYLHTLTTAVPSVANAGYYAEIVAQHARLRRVIQTGERLAQIGYSATEAGADLDDVLGTAMRELIDTETAVARPAERLHVRTIDEFLASDDDQAYDWVIPGLLERHDRIMLTGPEGGGKSTFARQLAVMAAAGLHPFTGDKTDPVRVLLVDLENSERQSRRKLRPLRLQAGELLDPDRLRVEVRPGGVDLLDRDDHDWFLRAVGSCRPDLLITGPIYRMASGDPIEEKTAKPVSRALDAIRNTGCAIFIETHTPHASNGQRRRPRRPFGASLWLRWPEFGIYLGDDGEVDHWRGPRDEREWPVQLKRGGEWPWTPETDAAEVLWTRIVQARREFRAEMSGRELAEILGVDRNRVQRATARHRDEWDKINHELPGDAA